MAYKKIKLTDDHIKLLQALKFEQFVFDGDSRNGRFGFGIDQYAPWGGDIPVEDIALILGHWDKTIKGTEKDYDGRKFPKELEDHFFDLYDDITNNMEYMLSLLAFYSDKGGLVPGTYKCNPRYKDWTKIE